MKYLDQLHPPCFGYTDCIHIPNPPCFAAAQISLQLVFLNIVQKLLGGRPETTLDTEDHGIHSDDVAPFSNTGDVSTFVVPRDERWTPKGHAAAPTC